MRFGEGREGEHVVFGVGRERAGFGEGVGELGGGAQAAVGVGDDQPHPCEAAIAQRAQELAPKGFALAVAEIAAEHFAVAVGGDPRRHRGRLADAVAHFETGGVDIDAGQLDVIESAAPEGLHGLVEPGADPRHLRLGDARLGAQSGDQVVHRAGRHARHTGLHDHGVQRPVDTPTELDHRRHETAPPQLGDPQLHAAGLGRQQTLTTPAALLGARLGALIAASADRLSRLGLDQPLKHQTHPVTHQPRAAPHAKALPQPCRDNNRQGQRTRPPR